MRALVLFILAALVIAAVAAAEHQRPNDGLPLVKADYELCTTVHPGPLGKPSRPDSRPQVSELS